MTQGEKNETSPATRATGIASSIEPEAAVSRNQSPIGCYVLDDVDERLWRRDRAEDAGGDPALRVEDHGRRDRPRGQHAAERQQCLAVGLVERGVLHAELPVVGERLRRRGVTYVDPDEAGLVAQLVGGLDQVRRLGDALGAPGAPDVDDRGLAAEVREIDRLAVEVLTA